MRQRIFLPFFIFLSVCFLHSNAQPCDPWIQQAYKQLYQRTATSEECNIKNYNNGSWNSYDELVNYIKAYTAKKQSAGTNTSCDPWIQQAYRQLYGRSASAAECNIRNYNNGSWGSYDELVKFIKAYNDKKNGQAKTATVLKGDPWIFQAYSELYNRKPNSWELNINNYNGGKWGRYAELKGYVREFQNSLRRQKLEIKTGTWNSGTEVVGFFIDGKQVAVDLVSTDGGKVVSAGGANVISAGGGNVVSAGGGNVVSAGGGNILVNPSMAGVTFGTGYSVQSEGTKVIRTSGKSTLLIR